MVEEASVYVGEDLPLSVSVLPSDATDRSLSWSSSNTSVVTVDSGGVVHGVSDGVATITATACDGSGKSASCEIYVSTHVVYVNETSHAPFVYIPSAGQTAQINYTVGPSDATDKTVTWVSQDTSVATVSSTGLVTAVGSGVAQLEGTPNGMAPGSSLYLWPKVYVGNLFSLSVSPSTVNADPNEIVYVTITGPSDFNAYSYIQCSLSAPSGLLLETTHEGTFDDSQEYYFYVSKEDSSLAAGNYSVTVQAVANGYTMASTVLTVTVP